MTLFIAELILVCLILPEVVMAVCNAVTGADHKKAMRIIRIGVILPAAAAYAAGLIRLELRTLPFALLLLISAAVGVVPLMHEKKTEKEGRKGRIIRQCLGRILLIILVMLPPLLFPEYKMIEPTGVYQTATVLYTYVDENRLETYSDSDEFRTLNVEFWYPQDTLDTEDTMDIQDAEKTYPLILFSHGGFGIKTSNESLFCELASHGYVVCSIDHTYQCFSTTDAEGNSVKMDPGYRKEIMTEDARKDPRNSYRCYQKWMGIRTGDISFVLDHILAETKASDSDLVYQIIDPDRIGVMGHSLGGSAALGIGRSREDVSAVVALEAPFMCDITGVTDGGFIFNKDDYPKPVLNVYSDSSWNILSDRAQYAENQAMLTDDDPDTFSIYIQGAGHLALTDLSLTTPILTSILDGKIIERNARQTLKIINDRTLEFFDCYLKGDGEFTAGGALYEKKLH